LGGQRLKDTLGNPNPTMTGLVTAIYDIGCALGAVVAFVFGERIGRKRSIILANLIVVIGAAIQTASFDYWQMFVARIIGGIGVGLSTVAVPILQSETLPAHNRGSLLVVQSALIIIGVAVASWLCFATLYADSSLQWRFPVACQILFSLMVLALCPFLCETPRWLASRGKIDEVCSSVYDQLINANAAPRQSTSSADFWISLSTMKKSKVNSRRSSMLLLQRAARKSLPGVKSLVTLQRPAIYIVFFSEWVRI
jgi:MFS family permease